MDTIYAWAAGFIDGEGTISIKRYFRKRKNDSFVYYQPFISASQAVVGGHEKAILKMQKIFGGSIANYKDKRSSTRYKTMAWSVVSKNALNCIELIYPYLVIKRANADVLIKFYKKRTLSKGGSRNATLTKKEHKLRESFFIASHLLNQKGKLRLQRLNEVTAKS